MLVQGSLITRTKQGVNSIWLRTEPCASDPDVDVVSSLRLHREATDPLKRINFRVSFLSLCNPNTSYLFGLTEGNVFLVFDLEFTVSLSVRTSTTNSVKIAATNTN